MQAAANQLFRDAWVRIVFEADEDMEREEEMEQLEIDAEYEQMAERLGAFGYRLRRGLNSRVFYCICGGRNYAIRWIEASQVWRCYPISGDEAEALRVLAIALGEIQT